MRVYQEMSVRDFETSNDSARYTLEIIIRRNLVDEFDSFIESVYPEGIRSLHLNDILTYEDVGELLGVGTLDEDEED